MAKAYFKRPTLRHHNLNHYEQRLPLLPRLRVAPRLIFWFGCGLIFRSFGFRIQIHSDLDPRLEPLSDHATLLLDAATVELFQFDAIDFTHPIDESGRAFKFILLVLIDIGAALIQDFWHFFGDYETILT